MAEHIDTTFESLLRSTLKAEAASLPVTIGPGDVLRRRAVQRRQRSRGRTRLLLIAALVALPLGAALVAAVLRPDPAAEYSAVLVRGVGEPQLQVLVASDGLAEQVIDVPASRFGAVRTESVLEAHDSGWIALQAVDPPEIVPYREYVVLFDASRPDATPIVRESGTRTGAWTPDGLYWSWTNTAYELIDPASGKAISLPRSGSEDLDFWYGGIHDGRMRVTEDSGLLLGDPSNSVQDEIGRPYPQQWAVLTPAGSTSRGLPELAEGIGPRLISGRWGLLQRCDASEGKPCPGRRSGSIISGPGSDGSYRDWGDDPPPHDHVIGASWAIDGGLWLLVDRRSGERTIVLIHRDPANVDREVASFALEQEVQVSFGDLAPDDSQIALALVGPPWLTWQTVVVDTGSGRSHLFDAAIGGFVRAQAARDWAPGEGMTVAGQLLARPTTDGAPGAAYPALPPLQDHTGFVEGRILLIHEVEATSADPGPTTHVTLGPVQLEEGIGSSLACSGPGEITVTEIGPDEVEPPHTHRCLSPSGYVGVAMPGARWESATVRVEYDPSTTWRLIIYDPHPPEHFFP